MNVRDGWTYLSLRRAIYLIETIDDMKYKFKWDSDDSTGNYYAQRCNCDETDDCGCIEYISLHNLKALAIEEIRDMYTKDIPKRDWYVGEEVEAIRWMKFFNLKESDILG